LPDSLVGRTCRGQFSRWFAGGRRRTRLPSLGSGQIAHKQRTLVPAEKSIPSEKLDGRADPIGLARMSAERAQQVFDGLGGIADQGAVVFCEADQVVAQPTRHYGPESLLNGLAEIQLSPALL
jgi:hypothetical protein